MKKIFILLPAFLAVFAISGCKGKTDGTSHSFDKDTSYALGIAYGSDVKNNIDMSGVTPDYEALVKGFRDGLTGKNMRFDIYEAMEILNRAFDAMAEERNAPLMEEENAFLAQNSQKPGINITSSGLQYEVIKEGSGPKPAFENTVLVHYTGTLTDGSVFDDSREYGEPVSIPLSRVVPGWTEGLQLMSVGSNYILYIPSNIGYGPEGMTNPMTGEAIIPPYATLIFDIELLGIE